MPFSTHERILQWYRAQCDELVGERRSRTNGHAAELEGRIEAVQMEAIRLHAALRGGPCMFAPLGELVSTLLPPHLREQLTVAATVEPRCRVQVISQVAERARQQCPQLFREET